MMSIRRFLGRAAARCADDLAPANHGEGMRAHGTASAAASPAGDALRTFRGGCECGAVLYEVELDPRRSSICADSVWERAVDPRGFRLLTGDQSLQGFQFSADGAHHFFCERCGVRSFSRHGAGTPADVYSIDLKCLHSPPLRDPTIAWRGGSASHRS